MCCSLLCENYAKRIGNEVGWVAQLIQYGANHINSNVNPKYGLDAIQLNYQAYNAGNNMQVVYLVNLFESFMQDFIGLKDGLSDEEIAQNDWKKYLSSEIIKWNKYCKIETKAINISTSFMNIRYSLFVLREKYGLRYPSYLTPLVFELGSLRNCLVHYDGDLSRPDKGKDSFKETLSETLIFLGYNNGLDKLNDISKNNYMNTVTFDLQIFVELCGGRIRRPADHEKENNT